MQENHSIKTVEIQFANAQLLPEIVKLLEEGHTVTLLLRGYSMRPFLEDNRDKALLTKAKDIKVGDAVLAEISYRHYVLHRIIKIQKQEVILRGDASREPNKFSTFCCLFCPASFCPCGKIQSRMLSRLLFCIFLCLSFHLLAVLLPVSES